MSLLVVLWRCFVLAAIVALAVIIFPRTHFFAELRSQDSLSGAGTARGALVRGILVVVAIALGSIALLWVMLGVAAISAYTYFFSTLVSETGWGTRLAQSVSLLLALFLFRGFLLAISLNPRVRRQGAWMVAACTIGFDLLIGFVTPTVRKVSADELFDRLGHPQASYVIVPHTGRIELFPADQRADRKTGLTTRPITPHIAERFRVQSQQDANAKIHLEMERGVALVKEEQQAFMDKYTSLKAPALDPRSGSLIVALDLRVPESLSIARSALYARLSDSIISRNMTPVLDPFTPAFYDDGLFDEVWAGDIKSLRQMGIPPSIPLLLGRASFSEAKPSGVEGFVSCRCQLDLRSRRNSVTTSIGVVTAVGAAPNVLDAIFLAAKRAAEAPEFVSHLEEPFGITRTAK